MDVASWHAHWLADALDDNTEKLKNKYIIIFHSFFGNFLKNHILSMVRNIDAVLKRLIALITLTYDEL